MARNNNGKASRQNNKAGAKNWKPVMKGKQGKKDNAQKRVNYDNTRESTFEKDIEKGAMSSTANDISEVFNGSQTSKSAATLPFASIVGQPLATKGNTGTVPGILIFHWAPNWGAGRGKTVMNKAFQQVYSYIVHGNSRNYNYEYTDLAIYTLASAEIFTAISEAIRVYGAAKAYSEENAYYGDAIISSLGFKPDDIRRNLGQMWFDINNLIMQTRQLWFPDVFPILRRWIRMSSDIYTDAPGKRSQVYMYLRTRFYQLSEAGNSQGASLVPALYDTSDGQGAQGVWAEFSRIGATNAAFTYDQDQTPITHNWYAFKSMIQNMINQVILSQDRGTIYGDILKAYGADKIYAMPEINYEYTVVPTYNAEILTEIENITVSRTFNPVGLFQLAQDQPNRLFVGFNPAQWNITDVGSIGYMGTKQILNLHVDGQPTPEMITIATRHKSGGVILSKERSAIIESGTGKPVPIKQSTGGYNDGVIATSKDPVNMHLPSSAGSEVINSVYMCWFSWSGSSLSVAILGINTLIPYVADATSTVGEINRWMRLMAFDWHPFIYRTIYDGSTVIGDSLARPNDAHGDYDNYIEMDDIELAKLNEAAYYVLYGIPQF